MMGGETKLREESESFIMVYVVCVLDSIGKLGREGEASVVGSCRHWASKKGGMSRTHMQEGRDKIQRRVLWRREASELLEAVR